MTDINTLAKLAIRTESMVPNLNGQKDNLKKSLELVIIAGTILDQVKRAIYYGEKGAYKPEKLNDLAEKLLAIEPFDFTHGEMVANTTPDNTDINTRVVHGIVGAITETSELAEALLHYMNTGSFDAVNLFEEMADVRWYEQILQDELGIEDKTLFEFLIAKLSVRYGDKFSDESATLRDIGSERDVMARFLGSQKPTV